MSEELTEQGNSAEAEALGGLVTFLSVASSPHGAESLRKLLASFATPTAECDSPPPKGLSGAVLHSHEFEECVEEWAREDIRTTLSQYRELGRFVFGVSSGFLAAATAVGVALAKVAQFNFSNGLFLFGLGLFVTASFLAILCAWPGHNVRTLGQAEENLEVQFKADAGRHQCQLILWSAAHFFGLVCCLASLGRHFWSH